MQEVFVKMGESIYPIRVNLTTYTFFELYTEILNIFCGYEIEALVNHFNSSYPDIQELCMAKGISAGHIFEIPMKHCIIYR